MPKRKKIKVDKARAAQRVQKIFPLLAKTYPYARTTLQHNNVLELLIATILAAQCTDKKVNEVTRALFNKYPTPAELAKADLETLEQEIRPTGFFRQKAKSITGCCRAIVEEHGGAVPGTMEALTALPGVGRKTANVVLGECFDAPGIIYAELQLERVTEGHLALDTSGHYARPDVFRLEVNDQPQLSVVFESQRVRE